MHPKVVFISELLENSVPSFIISIKLRVFVLMEFFYEKVFDNFFSFVFAGGGACG